MLPLLAIIGICLHTKAHDTYNIRQLGNRDGLSNSAVICLFQDKERYLWAGTYDGLNRYDGAEIAIYKPDIRNQYSISGNVIRRMTESGEDYLWIMTKGGLNKYSKKRDRVEVCFNEFPEDCVMACDSHGDFFIMKQTGELSRYDFAGQRFEHIEIPDFTPVKGWISLIIHPDDKVWITNNGEIRQYVIDRSDSRSPKLRPTGSFEHPHPISYIFYDKGVVTLIDRQRDLYVVRSGEKRFIRSIRSAMAEYGIVSSMLMDGNDIIIGFTTGGVIRLDHTDGYAVKKIPINCGVFSLLKDDVQDILWVGTDGQGVYACTRGEYIFRGINLEELPIKTQKPVRAIFSDHLGHLWLGTKGNGIVKIKNYEDAADYDRGNVEHLSIGEGLGNDAVFSFEMSRPNNVLWIGSGGPELNYYSFNTKRIHTLKTSVPVSFVEVHSIVETSDTTLWVASQFSLLKLGIHKNGNSIEARSVRRYEFDIKNKQLFNKIYSICRQSDSIMWLAMRGNGAIRFNSVTGDYRVVTFDDNGMAPMNDILSIHVDADKDVWLGSSYGINNLRQLADGSFSSRNYNESDGLINNTIHGILESRNGKLWFSSNTGIILFDPDKKTFRNFTSGLKVLEFSDNAYYKDEESSKYFFGGIDGVVWIEHGEKKGNDFVPPIGFTKLRILNEEVDIDDFMVRTKGRDRLQLKHNRNFFTVIFSANDFIVGAGMKFSYKLENFNEMWMNTASREAQFTNIPPGDYVLKVKYGSETEQESRTANLNIRILPPWYLNIYAKVFYVLATIGLLLLVYLYVSKRYERKRAMMARQLDQKYKEEMYENKLRFFTNITHEFCTPLTLIYTPSERILNYEGSDSFVTKYARIIKSNAERLNNLIQEIIDFRRMETGNKICKIEMCDINKICGEIADAFADLAEENRIDFRLDIQEDIMWNSDRSCIVTILNNLVSNAFKYTPSGGRITIGGGIEEERLVLRVYNSGKGIGAEEIPYLFNRYSVLDNVEQNSIKGLSSRNGLGLAICKSVVGLLEGEIYVESKAGEYAEFIVSLPARETSKFETAVAPAPEQAYTTRVKTVENIVGERAAKHSVDRPKILIVDDNREMLWVLKNILADEYHVSTAGDGVEGLKQLTSLLPDLVITDIMMPNVDGISMTKQIKIDPHTSHIPIVILSAKSTIDDKIEGVESGADAYIAKPFDTQYLKTVVAQLIAKHKKLREYYNSAASSFDYMDGQLLPNEERDFIRSAVSAIEQNIGDMEFSPEDLADTLGVSLRSLYRRLKELELPPPKDLIKKQRIEYSAKLLLSSNLTIQEIMYSAGFATRSHFYKEFAKRYGQSPAEYRGENRHADQ